MRRWKRLPLCNRGFAKCNDANLRPAETVLRTPLRPPRRERATQNARGARFQRAFNCWHLPQVRSITFRVPAVTERKTLSAFFAQFADPKIPTSAPSNPSIPIQKVSTPTQICKLRLNLYKLRLNFAKLRLSLYKLRLNLQICVDIDRN